MATFEAENFIEKSLYTIYREIPVKKLIVCEGGSKDNTQEILKKFPRVEIHNKPDIKSGGKILEYLFSKVDTEWFVFVDSDIMLEYGWYNEIIKYKKNFDVIENSKAILGYHFYREFPEKLENNYRTSHFCHLVKKEAVKEYHCDDDYMFRVTDYLYRQSIEKSGYTYGKVSSTQHVHNETERIPYESDLDKNYLKVVMKDPERIILNKQKQKEMMIKNAKAVIKYLDPNFLPFKEDKNLNMLIKMLDRRWIEENGPHWLDRYDSASNIQSGVKRGLDGLKRKWNKK